MGSGEPLVILHGFLGTLDNWQTIGRHLAEEYTVFLIDQRNHGKSPHSAEMNFAAMAEDLKEFLDQQWIFEKLRLIGHSMGGKTAMQFATEYPDMIHKMVIVDIAPKAYVGGHEDILKMLSSIDLTAMESRSEVQKKLEKGIHDQGTVQFLLKNLNRTTSDEFQWKMNLSVLVNKYDEISKEIKFSVPFPNPTLFIRGSESDYILDSDLPLIRKQFTHVQFERIEGAGHWVHADKPEQIIQSIRLFLAD